MLLLLLLQGLLQGLLVLTMLLLLQGLLVLTMLPVDRSVTGTPTVSPSA